MKIITMLNLEESETLKKNKVVHNSKFSEFLDNEIIEKLSELLFEKTDDFGFILGLSKINNKKVLLKRDYEDMEGYFPFMENSVLLELDVNDKDALSIPYEKLLELNNEYNKAMLADEKEYILTTLISEFNSLNYYTNVCDDVVTIFPSLHLADCKHFMMIDDDWGVKQYNLGNSVQLKVKKLDINE